MEETNTFFSIVNILRDADAFVFAAIVVWGLYKGKIRWGWDYDEDIRAIKAERDAYKAIIDTNHQRVQEKLDMLEAEARERRG